MNTVNLQNLSPLMQETIQGIISSGLGEVVFAPDGHIFVEPCVSINVLYGVLNERKDGIAAGEHIVMRRVRKRAKNSKYADMPLFQLYALPILKKNVRTMTDAERRNMEMNTQALRMAHAVESNPEQLAAYKELHETHKRNPQGYKKLYPNLFGFLVATFRMQLEAEQAKTESEKTPAINEAVAENRVPIIGSHKPKTPNHVTYNPFRYETNLPIHLCRARCIQPVGARLVRARSA